MRNRKNIIIGALIAVVLVMAVGYAAFSTMLNIQGTSSINSSWKIEITSVTPDKTASGTAPNYTTAGDITHSIGSDKLTANFSTALISPGDLVTYTIVVENKGSIDAKLETITKTNSNNEAITFEIVGISEGETLAAGASKTFTAKVGYSSSVTTQPTNTASSFGITLDYVQDDGSGTTPSTTTEGYIYDIKGHNIGDTIDPSTLSSDMSTDKNYALKYVLNSSNEIEEAYACAKYSFINEPVCVRGGTENGENPSNFYSANQTKLQGLESTFTSNSGSCTFYSSYSYCDAGDLGVFAGSDGYVNASDGSEGCYVLDSGSAGC